MSEKPKQLGEMSDLEIRAQRGDLYAELENVAQRTQMIQNGLRAVGMEIDRRRALPPVKIAPPVEVPKAEETNPE